MTFKCQTSNCTIHIILFLACTYNWTLKKLEVCREEMRETNEKFHHFASHSEDILQMLGTRLKQIQEITHVQYVKHTFCHLNGTASLTS